MTAMTSRPPADSSAGGSAKDSAGSYLAIIWPAIRPTSSRHLAAGKTDGAAGYRHE